jgi:hypothetical protein
VSVWVSSVFLLPCVVKGLAARLITSPRTLINWLLPDFLSSSGSGTGSTQPL